MDGRRDGRYVEGEVKWKECDGWMRGDIKRGEGEGREEGTAEGKRRGKEQGEGRAGE